MPKELTHLIVSDLAIKRMERDSPGRGGLLRNHYDLFLLGSIIPDTAYYHTPLPGKGENISFLSDRIHTGRGCLEIGFLKRSLEKGLMGDERAFAFSCGILSHHLADAGFHPFVVYYTGNYADPDLLVRKRAQARHRFLEGLIDLKIVSDQSLQVGLTSRIRASSMRKMPSPMDSLSLFIKSILPQEGDHHIAGLAKRLDGARLFQLRLLGLYDRAFFKGLILLFNRLSGYEYDHYAGLLYADRSYLSLKLLSETGQYLDPFTGNALRNSPGSILDETVDKVAGALLSYGEGRIDGQQTLPHLFDTLLPDPGEEREESMPSGHHYDTGEMEAALKRFTGRKG